MSEDRYRVPAGPGRAEIRERRSRFLARVEPVAGDAEAKRRLDALAERHRDATHHCWAWRLGSPAAERWSDAREPSGTAGMPILQVLRGAGLSDVLAVVTRWFGGTKLGKGGLARAYAAAVREALAVTPTGERLVYDTLELAVPYARLGEIQRLVHPPEIELVASDYGEEARCTLRVVPPRRAAVLERLAALGIEVSRAPEGPRGVC